MNWIWLNMPLGALIFLAVAGIPLWMVIRHPDTGPDAQAARRAAQTPARVPVYVAAGSQTLTSARQRRADQRHTANRLVSAR
jgi:hypothetical protein